MDENNLTKALAQRLGALKDAGVTNLPKAQEVSSAALQASHAPSEPNADRTQPAVADQPRTPSAPRTASQAATKPSHAPTTPAPTSQPAITQHASPQPADPSPVSNDPADLLQLVQQDVKACTQCSELAGSRTQTVFGVGNPKARLCMLGEAPGADEDRLGEPFVGRAGQLLNKILEACTLSREDVYILNILKCRPPGNRNPAEQEAKNCRQFLDRQLDIIKPEFICCLGSVAVTNLLHTTQSVGKLRGQLHDYRGIKVAVTYHPAYLLRNPSAKKHTWDDMKMLMREMGIQIPGVS